MHTRTPLLAAATVLVGLAGLLAGCTPTPVTSTDGDPVVVAETWSETTAGAAASGCEFGSEGDAVLPDADCTPGAVRSEISAANTSLVCTASQEVLVPDETKKAVLAAYGIDAAKADAYVVNYLIPRAIGGANDFGNLWPIPLTDSAAAGKADVDEVLAEAVCDGRTGIQAAQFTVAQNWATALAVLGIRSGTGN